MKVGGEGEGEGERERGGKEEREGERSIEGRGREVVRGREKEGRGERDKERERGIKKTKEQREEEREREKERKRDMKIERKKADHAGHVEDRAQEGIIVATLMPTAVKTCSRSHQDGTSGRRCRLRCDRVRSRCVKTFSFSLPHQFGCVRSTHLTTMFFTPFSPLTPTLTITASLPSLPQTSTLPLSHKLFPSPTNNSTYPPTHTVRGLLVFPYEHCFSNLI